VINYSCPKESSGNASIEYKFYFHLKFLARASITSIQAETLSLVFGTHIACGNGKAMSSKNAAMRIF
jgi:hypothetical protein